MPTRIIAGFEELGLSAYINGAPLLGTWWSRADLYNTQSRENNMAPEVGARWATLPVARFLSFLRIVFVLVLWSLIAACQ